MIPTEYVLNVQEEGCVFEHSRSPATPSGRANLEKLQSQIHPPLFSWITTVFDTALIESTEIDESLELLEEMLDGKTNVTGIDSDPIGGAAANCNCGEAVGSNNNNSGPVSSFGAVAPKGATAVFPAIGETQCCAGVINGIWYTWTVYSGKSGKRFAHSNRDDAFLAHDNNIDILKAMTGATI